MNIIATKFKEVLFSVLPITIIVLILNFTIAPLESVLVIRFLIGSLLIIIGLTVFLIGVDIGISPLGTKTGAAMAKSNKVLIVLVSGIILGFFVSIAEPGLMVLANQVGIVTSGQITSTSILIVVSIGLAIMLALGFLRMFYNIPLYKILFFIYLVIFGFSIFASRELLAIAFDASGATTGILAVPFILSLSLGVSKLKKHSKESEEDSFGLVAMASSGAIIAVLLLDIITKPSEFAAELNPDAIDTSSIFTPFIEAIPTYLWEGVIALLPLVVIFFFLQFITFKLKKREFRKLITGFGFTFIGLFIFLVGVNAGFMDLGTSLANKLTLMDNKIYIIIISFVLGVVTILAEPAVHVLTHQIEDVTSGYVKRSAVLFPLAIGVGAAVCLSIIRILVPEIQLWHYLLPGYIICLTLMFFTPKLFVGIAFDAGGVATGPMTATFILAFTQGAANAFEGADLMAEGFGMISMVAMTPIITLQILGLVFQFKAKKRSKKANE